MGGIFSSIQIASYRKSNILDQICHLLWELAAIRLLHIKYPFYGYRKVTKSLRKMGFAANRKKVLRLRNELKIRAIYPKPDLSKANKEHKKYPYLLGSVSIVKPNQAWCTDLTYIRIKNKGWVYLVAIIDYYSRHIVAHQISISLEVDFCIATLEEALRSTKDIFNSD